jgi:hypothetical protein
VAFLAEFGPDSPAFLGGFENANPWIHTPTLNRVAASPAEVAAKAL